MTFRQADRLVRWHPTEEADSGKSAHGFFEKAQMPRPRDAVEDHAHDVEPRVERGKPVNDRGHAARHTGGIDYQDDRQPQPFRHFRGTAGLVIPVAAVEQPHHAFHDAHGAVMQATRERVAVVCARQHPAVEVSGLPAADHGVVARIDEVRADLERLNGHAAIPERGEQSEGQRGFADAAVRAGHDEAARRRRTSRLAFYGHVVFRVWARALTIRALVPGVGRRKREASAGVERVGPAGRVGVRGELLGPSVVGEESVNDLILARQTESFTRDFLQKEVVRLQPAATVLEIGIFAQQNADAIFELPLFLAQPQQVKEPAFAGHGGMDQQREERHDCGQPQTPPPPHQHPAQHADILAPATQTGNADTRQVVPV